jgi:hypothetical protein
MPEAWKTVRVFISSTFRDMQAERDHLVRFVFPRLRETLLKRILQVLRQTATRLSVWSIPQACCCTHSLAQTLFSFVGVDKPEIY